ncbi:MAG: tail fiber domain-containing protein [Candidatus Pelethousia sp.]|nr:tail fiber domain-containing protein [Candidatus Pelethousia sp.]
MYHVSEQFHEAVAGPFPSERVLLRFGDGTFFTGEDIVASKELKWIEALNSEEELTIGSCPASELGFTLHNEHGLLSGYSYGECEALLGVRTASETSPYGPGPVAVIGYGEARAAVFRGSSIAPFLTVDGVAPAAQPLWPVHALLGVGNTLYCIAEDGAVWAATWADGSIWNSLESIQWDALANTTWNELRGELTPIESSISPFMQNKAKGWAETRRGMWWNMNTLYEFTEETVDKYEYAPLGYFIIEAPKKRRVSQVGITAYDRMVKFDADAAPFLASITYPITHGELLTALCAYVGVPLATPSFINGTRVLDEAPFEAEDITCREVAKWIAEAAGAYGRMSRDGELELAWFGSESVAVPANRSFSAEVAEYSVQPIDKLQVLSAQNDIGVIIGEGTNGYQIMDNPFLYGATDTEIRTLAVPIFNRLAAFSAFSPITARAVCDWAVQAGDVIAITVGGVAYSLPVYRQTMTWAGGTAKVVYESTGSPSRPVMSATNRRVWNQKRAIHELSVTVEGFSSRIEDAEGNIADLNLTTAGLALAINENKLSFGADGLTVQGGGLRVKNNAGANVFYADTSGNLTLRGDLDGVGGSFSTLSSSQGINFGSGSLTIGNWGQSSQAALSFSGGATEIVGGSGWLGLGSSGYVSIEGSEVRMESPYVFGIPASSGGNQYLAWNMSTGEVLYSSPSSIRFKKDIEDIDADYAKDVIMALEIKRFAWKDSGEFSYGAIAEKVAGVCPWLVNVEHVNGRDIPLGVAYEANLPIMMVPVVQEHERQIDALIPAVQGLLSRIAALEAS